MEHDKRSKAAISIMEHRGREQGAEGAANTIAPAQLLSQHTLASARVRPSAAFCCAPKRSIEEIVKQTTAYAHDSSARQSAHAPCIHGRRGKLAASRQRPGRPTRRMEPKGRVARPPCRCSASLTLSVGEILAKTWRHASSSSATSFWCSVFTAACTQMSSVPPSRSGRLRWTGAGCRLVADQI